MLNQKSDTYLGNINVKRDGVQHEFTKKEVNEYVKCSNDPVYFCEKYLKIISLDEGLFHLNFILINMICLITLIRIDFL